MKKLKRSAAPVASAVGLALIATGGLTMSTGSVHAADVRDPATHLPGVWVVTVDPLPTPAGDQPPFESTLAYDEAKVVHEITSRAAGSSAGLGRWRKVGPATYRTSWLKYRFDPSGAYIGKTIVREKIAMEGSDSYTAHSVTSVVNTAGIVVARFESDAVATRMPR